MEDAQGSTKYVCVNIEYEAPVPPQAGLPGGYSDKPVPAIGAKVPDDWHSAVTCVDAESLEPVFTVPSDYGNFDIQDSTPDGQWVLSTIYNIERGSNIDEMIKADEDAVQFLHLPTAEKALKEGTFALVNGVKTLDPQAISGLVTLLPAARSPHGIHCQRLANQPGVNSYCAAAGKLAPVVNIYDVRGPQPTLVARPEVCLGPLHVQYDGRRNAYVSCFIYSQIAAFNVERAVKSPTDPKQYLIDKIGSVPLLP